MGHRLQFRIGINSGPVIAGVIGQTKFHYDIWGDAVNGLRSHKGVELALSLTTTHTHLGPFKGVAPTGL